MSVDVVNCTTEYRYQSRIPHGYQRNKTPGVPGTPEVPDPRGAKPQGYQIYRKSGV